MSLLIVTAEFDVELALPIVKPLRFAMLLMVIALIEPVPIKFAPEPLHVNVLATPEPSVNKLPNGAMVKVPVLVMVVALLAAW